MDNQNIIIILLIIVIAGILVSLGAYFALSDTNMDNQTILNNTNNTTNTTSNISADSSNTDNSNSDSNQKTVSKTSSSKSGSDGYDEDIDLSEKAGRDCHVTIHHNGDGTKSWTDSMGSHTASEDEELVF